MPSEMKWRWTAEILKFLFSCIKPVHRAQTGPHLLQHRPAFLSPNIHRKKRQRLLAKEKVRNFFKEPCRTYLTDESFLRVPIYSVFLSSLHFLPRLFHDLNTEIAFTLHKCFTISFASRDSFPVAFFPLHSSVARAQHACQTVCRYSCVPLQRSCICLPPAPALFFK